MMGRVRLGSGVQNSILAGMAVATTVDHGPAKIEFCTPDPSDRLGSDAMVMRRHIRRHNGLSLMEVILALAILGISLATLGQLVRIGMRHAEEARELGTAQLLCESKLEEIAAAAAPCQSASGICETDDRWQYTVTTSTLDQSSLLEVRVTVEQVEATRTPPLSFSLVRWMIDPSM